MLMRFCVSVPVLSLQITLAAPSVSTAGRWRTSAFFFAMRCVAIASDSVTVGSNPSGTFATMMPIANTRFSQNDRPIICPIRKNRTPSSVANSATSRDRRAISFCSGDSGSRAACVRRAMLPNSVCMPVAYTIAFASPEISEVPACRMSRRKAACSSGSAAALRAIGLDSPVRLAVLTRTPNASIRRQSAGTSSPAASSTTSPGTSSATGNCTARPSRKAVVCCGSRLRNAASAFSARYSCQNENSPLIRITPSTA